MIDTSILQGIVRVDQSAINSGAIILACCRADLEGAKTIDLEVILKEKLLDMTHDFAYQSRKVIERARMVFPDLLGSLMEVRPHGSNEVAIFDDEMRADLTNRSFWWVINRIVHSQEARIITNLSSVETTYEGSAVIMHDLRFRGPKVIAFRSSHDKPGVFCYVGLENLVIAYVDKIRKPIFDAMGMFRKGGRGQAGARRAGPKGRLSNGNR